MRFLPWVPPAISPQAKTPSSVVSRVLVDHEPTVLVVEDGVRVDRLGERVDPAAAVPAQHVRKRDLRVLGAMRVVSSYTAGRPSGVSHALALLDLVDDRRDTASRGPSESVNSSPSAFSNTAPYARVVSGIE